MPNFATVVLLTLLVTAIADFGYSFCHVPVGSRRQFDSRVFATEEGRRAIGDIVQGLHGSKYQFNDAGANFEGQQFAEMGYSSGEVLVESYENNPIVPQWALKMKEMTPPTNAPALRLNDKVSVNIRNDERSWEKYYAFIVGPAAETTTVRPWVGQLAPRGGSNMFSDSAVLEISCPTSCVVDEESFLVIGTEAEKWFYKLVSVNYGA